MRTVAAASVERLIALDYLFIAHLSLIGNLAPQDFGSCRAASYSAPTRIAFWSEQHLLAARCWGLAPSW